MGRGRVTGYTACTPQAEFTDEGEFVRVCCAVCLYIFVFLSQTIYLVIDFALYALHSAFEVNSAAVPYVCMLQACCGSAGCVYTHLGTWRQSMGRMFV